MTSGQRSISSPTLQGMPKTGTHLSDGEPEPEPEPEPGTLGGLMETERSAQR